MGGLRTVSETREGKQSRVNDLLVLILEQVGKGRQYIYHHRPAVIWHLRAAHKHDVKSKVAAHVSTDVRCSLHREALHVCGEEI